MGQLNQCCSDRASEEGGLAELIPITGGGKSAEDEQKFHDELLSKYRFHRIDFSTFGGETEGMLLVEQNATTRSPPILLQRFLLNPGDFMQNKRMEQQLEILKSIPGNLFQDLYKRDRGMIYIKEQFLGQGTRDLYMLANIRGAFSEAEIGSIAYQLLTQVQQYHEAGLQLYQLTPQTVLVREGFNRGQKIKVQFSHVAAMLVTQAQHQVNASFISGVDRVFLAPELNAYRMGPKSDVWSIGVMLYLLVTGGVTEKRHEEFFNFQESIWHSVSEEMKELILLCVTIDPRQRGSVTQLLELDFIRSHKAGELDAQKLEETNLTDVGANMYKFYMAHCINEICCRYRSNKDKTKKIFSIREAMAASHNENDKKTPGGDDIINFSQNTFIVLEQFMKCLVSKFGEFEAVKITNYFETNGIENFTFDDAIQGVNQLFEEDLDEIIAQVYDKLDITDESYLTVKYIRQGLLVNARTHINPMMKVHNKTLLKHVYDMKSSKQYDKVEFGEYIRKCLEQQQEVIRPTIMAKMNINQYQQAGSVTDKGSARKQNQLGSQGSM